MFLSRSACALKLPSSCRRRRRVGTKKAKEKKKEAPPAKGAKAASPEPGEVEEVIPPELVLTAGAALPAISLRLRAENGSTIVGETGRRFQVSMFKERIGAPAVDENSEPEVLRRPINFGDRRPNYRDPLDGGDPVAEAKAEAERKAAAAKAQAKAGAAPVPVEDETPPPEGEEVRDGVLQDTGEFVLGESEDEWFIPSHLQEAIYWLRVVDATPPNQDCIFQPIDQVLEFPVLVVKPA